MKKEIKHRIWDKDWTIKFVPKESPELKAMVTGNAWWGIEDYENLTIYLANDIHPNAQRETLIHELTHAYMAISLHREKKFDEEFICDFNGRYASAIVKDTDEILNNTYKKEESE